jgi:DNA-binding transcriptional ArsR family regulator
MGDANSDSAWARLPNAWIYDDGLTAFSAAPTRRGASGAALKVLIAILLRAVNRRADEAGADQGSALVTYDELMDLTDLSRAMIAKGVALLRKTEIITAETSPGKTTRYVVRDYGPTDTFGRVPKGRLYRGAGRNALLTLHDLSLRNEADVNALKLYLLMCAIQNNRKRAALVNYQTIREKTGIAEIKIRRALSVLYEHGLVRNVREEPDGSGKPPPTRYDILGL